MKKIKIKLSQKKKRVLINSGIFVALFGIAAGTTFYVLPQRTIDNSDEWVNADDDGGNNGTAKLTAAERFVANLTESAASGLSLDFNVLDAYFPGKDKDDASKGNKIDAKGTEVAFTMDDLSLHGISLGLKAKLDYNGYKRQLNLGKHLNDIYFSVSNLDNASAYDLKYKASIEPIVSDEVDETTGGIVQYKYGNVGWIISDVLSILSSGGINVDFPSIDLSSLSSGESGDMSAILDSLSGMKEDEANSYFVWSLPLGDATLDIGLAHDEEYGLKGIDFPAKTFDGKEQSSFEIENNGELIGTIRASATVKTGTSAISWSTFIPKDDNGYHDLKDSASLFRKIARYAASPEFGIKTTNSLNVNNGNGLVLTHYSWKDGKATNEKVEQAYLDLSGSASFKGGMQNFEASLDLGADAAKASIFASYNGEKAYLNVDDMLMAKVSKTNLDALFAETASALGENSEVEESAEEASDIADLISIILDKFPTIKSFAEGHYEKAFDFVKSIKGSDNNLSIVFDLSPLNIEGEIALAIDGTYASEKESGETDTYLSGITFNNVKLSAFSIDGTLSLGEYSLSSINEDDYDELTHLKGVKDQIEDITSSKEAGLSLSGSVLSGSKDSLGKDIGVSFDGDLGFSYNKKEGGIKLTLNQNSAYYAQDHHFAFALNGDGNDFTSTAFSYDSKNDVAIDENGKDSDGKSRTNPRSDEGVTGRMGISSLKDIVSTVKSFITEQEDNDQSIFQKIASSLSEFAASDLASELISKKYSSLLEKKVLAEKASLGGDSNVFVLNGSLFGLSENPKVEISYQANEESSDGGLKSISFSTNNVALSLGLEATSNVSDEVLNPLNGIDTSSFTDFNTLKTLVDYACSSSKLGIENSGDTSVYDISLNIGLNIGSTPIDLFGVSLNVASEKDYIKAHLSIPSMPLIKGVNAPDDSLYFRDYEYEGKRAVDLYYSYQKGDEDYGDLFITRNSSYGRVTDVKDTVTLKGKDLVAKNSDETASYSYNGIGWLLEYVLGVNESYLRKSDEEANEENVASASGKEGSSLFDNAFPHPEDFLKQYRFDEDSTAWSLGADIGSLLDERGLLGDADIVLRGKNVTSSNSSTSWHTLSALDISFGLALGDPDGSHQLVPASIKVSLSLDNVSDGVYVDTWSDTSVNDFTSVVSYEDGEPVFSYGDSRTKRYSQSGDEPLSPGNYYAGVTIK